MIRVKTAVLGAVLLASTALAASAPAKAQGVQFEGYVGTDPYYGTDPNYGDDPYYGQGYQDPAYDPYYDQQYAQNYQDPAYDPYYDQQYSDQQYYGDYSGDYYNYDYSDPNYYYTPTYTPIYDPFYDPYCDYYTPPWGFPLDYCRYQTWNQPVYFGGLWYSRPDLLPPRRRCALVLAERQLVPRPMASERGQSYIDWSRNRRWNGNRHNWRDEYRRGNVGWPRHLGRPQLSRQFPRSPQQRCSTADAIATSARSSSATSAAATATLAASVAGAAISIVRASPTTVAAATTRL